MNEQKTKVVILIQGGNFHGAWSNDMHVEVKIIDADNLLADGYRNSQIDEVLRKETDHLYVI